MNEKLDFRYTLSDEQLLAYSNRPILDRLKWLDEVRRFTLMVRAAPLEAEESRRQRDVAIEDTP